MNALKALHLSPKQLILAAAAAVFFLAILPYAVITLASNATGIAIAAAPDASLLPDYHIAQERHRPQATYYAVTVAKDTPADDLQRIARTIANTHYDGQREMTFRFMAEREPDSTSRASRRNRAPIAVFTWTRKDGVMPAESFR